MSPSWEEGQAGSQSLSSWPRGASPTSYSTGWTTPGVVIHYSQRSRCYPRMDGGRTSPERDSLRLHTGKHLSSLPGMPFPAHTSLFPTRSEFAEYLESYVDKFQLPIRTGVETTGLLRENGGWTVETGAARYESKAVVVATGIMSSPVLPTFRGMASYTRLMFHSTEYRRPDERLGWSILVVGIGNSAAEIASELVLSQFCF